MPRLPRECFETRFFHVIIQGINREYIFKKSEDIEEYLKLIKINKKEYDVEVIAYCIMNNHAHLLLYVKNSKELIKFMHKINMVYAIYYNKKEKRVGYVFRDRYKSEPIYNEEYLLSCIVYIHMNPVEAKIVDNAREYKYSSYNEYINKKDIINKKSIELAFGSTNYIEQFEYIHGKENIEQFIDIIDDNIDKCKKIIEGFITTNNTNLDIIKNNTELLIKLLIELKLKNKISYRKIEKEIGISREKLRRLNVPK